MPATLPVIINGASGAGHDEGVASAIESGLRGSGARPRIVLANGSDIGRWARDALREGPARVIAAGGDGTVSAVASALAGSGVPLAVLPLGTLNHFARDLGIPGELDAALRVALNGRVREVDVGEVNGRVFVNNSSIGLYAAMVHRRERQQRRFGRGKWHAMLWAAYNALRVHPFLHLTIEVGGVEHRRRTPFVFVGNNAYRMQGLDIGARERLDAGALSLYLAHRTGRMGLVRIALRALFGRLYQGDDFEAASATRLRIDARHKRLLVATDGEVQALELPLEYRIRPRALRVVAP